PGDARAWRRLGEILAEHGGVLEADRADAALREAMALEPSWYELWLLRAKVAIRQGRSQDALRLLDRYRRAGGARPGRAGGTSTAGSHAADAGAERQGPRAPDRRRQRGIGRRPRALAGGAGGLARVR